MFKMKMRVGISIYFAGNRSRHYVLFFRSFLLQHFESRLAFGVLYPVSEEVNGSDAS